MSTTVAVAEDSTGGEVREHGYRQHAIGAEKAAGQVRVIKFEY